jgi:tetratricopeptide (TPR) repeat protein
MTKLMGALLFAMLLLVPTAARADNVEEAKAHYKQGNTAYDLQDYVTAAHEYEEAFRLVDDPALLFNIGQANRFANNYSRAIGAFRSYLRRVPDSPNRAEVEGRIAEMRRVLEEQKSSKEKPPAGTLESTGKPGAPAVVLPPLSSQVERRRPDRRLRNAGLAVGVLGVALLAVGGGMAGLAVSDADKLNNPPKGAVFDSSQERRLGTDTALEAAFFAVGGAALVSGVVIYAVAAKRARRMPVAVAPIVAPGRATLTARVSF